MTVPARQRADHKRLERAERILDAAYELVLRMGYDKTTVDDIVRSSGVPKGTIYLHWRSRDALFAALFRRDRLQMLEQLDEQVRADPDGPSLRSLIRQTALLAKRRPLLGASIVGDSEVLGRMMREKQRRGIPPELHAAIERFLITLSAHGVVRADLTISEYANVVFGTMYGFLAVTPQLTDDLRLSDEHSADLLADVIVRAIAPEPTARSDGGEAVAAAVLDYIDGALETARAKWQESLEPPT